MPTWTACSRQNRGSSRPSRIVRAQVLSVTFHTLASYLSTQVAPDCTMPL
jgi:hypothetical protein